MTKETGSARRAGKLREIKDVTDLAP